MATHAFERGATRQEAEEFLLKEIERYIYAGDTGLHIAAAAYRSKMIRDLVSAGADIRAENRHSAEPLHAAAVGIPGSHFWNPRAQAAAVRALIKAGADPNAADKSGVTPLHRAVRTRCAAAVKALLENGADARQENKSGSTPMTLATLNTGRGQTGSPEAKTQQRQIIRLLERHGAEQLSS